MKIQMENKPIREYSEEWYSKCRPQKSLGDKKIVDSQIIEVLNTEKKIHRQYRDNLA
jgi:hypothetical protein